MEDDYKYKDDKEKPLAAIIFQDFPRALKKVVEVATFGSKKYKRSSWPAVPNARERYEDAMFRHLIDYFIEGKNSIASDSKLKHLSHALWNMMAILELDEREAENNLVEQIKVYPNPSETFKMPNIWTPEGNNNIQLTMMKENNTNGN